MSIRMNKKMKKNTILVSTRLNDGIVPALLVYQLVGAEREVGASIFGCTYLLTSIVLGTSFGMP